MLKFQLDPKHESFDLYNDLIVHDIWKDKYRHGDEKDPGYTFLRVAKAIYAKDPNKEAMDEALTCMCKGLFMPGGRILAGAGTDTKVTLMNCYVNSEVEDKMESIGAGLANFMQTASKGGGVGTDFSNIRPKGACLNVNHLTAPGPLVYMDLWNTASSTIMQAGHRRGGMMGTMICTHPDLPEFIEAKREKGRLQYFNISVLITDAFMIAVKCDWIWFLHFTVPPAQERTPDLIGLDFVDEKGIKHYVYSVWRARDLWSRIIHNTYNWAEPGVIFIDRINRLNNLQYCETLSCTNPCGEQPLPPNGTCNLGAINLARIIKDPFTVRASIDWDLLKDVVKTSVRFLDNVIDVTNYPLESQRDEELNKRRLGLGISGLADMLAQMGIVYGSKQSVVIVEAVMETIARTAYAASAELGKERGRFPFYDDKMFETNSFASRWMLKTPMRNGVLLTIAPTGTTSIMFGNISSGIEPVFAHRIKRKVIRAGLKEDGSYKDEYYDSWGFGARFYVHCLGTKQLKPYYDEIRALPEYMVEANTVTIDQHLAIQAVCQNWIDASVSKTINCPADISFKDFEQVYFKAYEMGCKGCTTYRPSPEGLEIRGVILEKVEEPETIFITKTGEGPIQTIQHKDGSFTDMPFDGVPIYTQGMHDRMEAIIKTPNIDVAKSLTPKAKRANVLNGCTYKINWPTYTSAIYLTINEMDGAPWEVFIASKDLKNSEWTTATTMFISILLANGKDPMYVAEKMKEIQGAHDGHWVDKKFYVSLPAYLGSVMEEHFARYANTLNVGSASLAEEAQTEVPLSEIIRQHQTITCPTCHSPTLIATEGCKKCINCGYSTCS